MKDSPIVFIDTNILIYRSFGSEVQKKLIDELLKSHEAKTIISIQVLNEFVSATSRKKLFDSDKILTQTLQHFVKNFMVAPLSTTTIFDAVEIRKRYQYSHYDSLIIASALENNCSILYSEDLQHGQKIKGQLKIVNPFLS